MPDGISRPGCEAVRCSIGAVHRWRNRIPESASSVVKDENRAGGHEMADPETTDPLRDALRTPHRHSYIDLLVPLRPALPCLQSPADRELWDAEDLIQDTLLRGFGQLGVSIPRSGTFAPTCCAPRPTRGSIGVRRRETRDTRGRRDARRWHRPMAEGPRGRSDRARRGRPAHSRCSHRRSGAAIVLKEVFDMTLEGSPTSSRPPLEPSKPPFTAVAHGSGISRPTADPSRRPPCSTASSSATRRGT